MNITTNPTFIFISTKLYLCSIYFLTNYMKNKNPYVLKTPLIIYNTFQVLLNIYIIQGLIGLPQITFNDNLKYFTYIHYLSKYLDYCDTWFIILRKKDNQLTFFHIYHHYSIGIIWGMSLHNGVGNGTGSFGCLLNSIIHFLMYTHYLWTSFGYNNPFKKLITRFDILFLHSIVVLFYQNIYPKHYEWIQLGYQLQMFTLFTNFYKKNYQSSK